MLNLDKKWHFFICFASCLILGNADNQQGRGVKCIINYWEGATSLLELILMLLLPLWVMWGGKYFSEDRGAAPQRSFAYQINSRAPRLCQPRRLCCMYSLLHMHAYVCERAIEVYWISPVMQVMVKQCLWWSVCVQTSEEASRIPSFTYDMWHFAFGASQVNLVIKTKLHTVKIIRNFTQVRLHSSSNWFCAFEFRCI